MRWERGGEFYQGNLLKVLFRTQDVSLLDFHCHFWLFKWLASMTGTVSPVTAPTAITRLLCTVSLSESQLWRS